jgi:hypothetical protein
VYDSIQSYILQCYHTCINPGIIKLRTNITYLLTIPANAPTASWDHLSLHGTNPNSEQCSAIAGVWANTGGMQRSLYT